MKTKGFWTAVVVILVVGLAGTAFAQAAPVSANQTLADAVRAAEAVGNLNAALDASTKLEASAVHDDVWSVNARKLANLLADAGKLAQAEEWLKTKAIGFAAEAKAGGSDYPAGSRMETLVTACIDVARREPDPARRLDLARLGLFLDPGRGDAFDVLFAAFVASGKPDDALQACLDYAGKLSTVDQMRVRRMKLLASQKRNDDLRAETVEYFKVVTDPMAAARALQTVLPANDASLCCGLTAQEVLDGYKVMLRGKDARLNPQVLTKLAEQLTKGGDARPLVVTDEAKALAGKLAGAPLEKFIVPLLQGDYASAIKEGYARAKASTVDADYVRWVNATAGAVRCMDQCYNGRALDFITFLNGATDVNPVAGVIGE